jgi:hypothetical protein
MKPKTPPGKNQKMALRAVKRFIRGSQTGEMPDFDQVLDAYAALSDAAALIPVRLKQDRLRKAAAELHAVNYYRSRAELIGRILLDHQKTFVRSKRRPNANR